MDKVDVIRNFINIFGMLSNIAKVQVDSTLYPYSFLPKDLSFSLKEYQEKSKKRLLQIF